MRLLTGKVKNFGSYRELEFDFNDQGLVLIKGATGSGKSTLQDIPTWILYGITSKNGTVDEVRNWDNRDEITSGELSLELINTTIKVYRSRGSQSSQNDLYWIEETSEQPIRGKDLSDTQKLLESRLQVSKDLYLVSATLNEFSDAGNFFVSKAKDRRQLFESIANLVFPKELYQTAADNKKNLNKILKEKLTLQSHYEGQISQLEAQISGTEDRIQRWDTAQAVKIAELKLKAENFEQLKTQKLEALGLKYEAFEDQRSKRLALLYTKRDSVKAQTTPPGALEKAVQEIETHIKHKSSTKCAVCNSAPYAEIEKHVKDKEKITQKIIQNNKLISDLAALNVKIETEESLENRFLGDIENESTSENHYKAQFLEASTQQNPYISTLEDLVVRHAKLNGTLSALSAETANVQERCNQLEQLQDLSADLRGLLLKRTVDRIQNTTNEYIESVFESEFKVSFELSGLDNLDVSINKNGLSCTYRQLSKGQRCILRLCFAVSVMEIAALNAAHHFTTLFFDEALDGMDSNFKLKTFALFQKLQLNHASVFVIDHTPEFQNLFEKQYLVELKDDKSIIKED